ncbi:hypothetical protein ACIBL6_42375 [Streptomyces sp. NPDC050400]|uniref:hypothetical protein n=1 Tax=Streptomyces sp. NPDC050400 TaxID=3365610 RepID=UPI0037B799D6
MHTVRRLSALVTALMAALAMILLGASQASAGGPTSVLVVSPESQESAALYFSDKEYGRLTSLLGRPDQKEELPPGLGVGAGRQLNVTWMIHDVQPWRLDRVYPDTPGSKEVWIHTSTDMPELSTGHWHKAEQPAALRALLRKLGVMGKKSEGGAAPVFPAPGRDQEAATPATSHSAVTTRSGDTDWWWAVPGLVAGAAMALLLRPLVIRLPQTVASIRQRKDTGPRQELRDI